MRRQKENFSGGSESDFPHGRGEPTLNEQHLKRLLSEYVRYYHEDRTHLGLAKDTPAGRPTAISPAVGSNIHSFPRLGGLHHRYAVEA